VSNELTTAPRDTLELLTTQLDGMIKAAGALRKSGLLPKGITSDEAALAILLAGRELGMGPMESFRSFHVINGRPTMDASAQLARAVAAGVVVQWQRSDAEAAIVMLARNGGSFTSEFTIAMAKRAGLTERNPTWRAYPEAMLRARAITAGIRAFCPDVVGGPMYSADEVEAAEVTPEPPPVALVVRATPASSDGRGAPLPWTPGEHHGSWGTEAKAFCTWAHEDGVPYDRLAPWCESDDAATFRAGLAKALEDAGVEAPWRPSWLPAPYRARLRRVLSGKPELRNKIAAWTPPEVTRG
jgi:hypothetical protein